MTGSLACDRVGCHAARPGPATPGTPRPGYDAPMDDQPARPASDPAPDPGERRLSRPPSDRYRPAEPEAPGSSAARSPIRGIAFALVIVFGLAVAITVLGGSGLLSAGLVVVAGAGGWAIAIALRMGAGATIPRPRRTWLAVALALAAVALGQVGLWLFARTEGGVLPLVDYLAQVFGPLVPLQAVAATILAGWTAR